MKNSIKNKLLRSYSLILAISIALIILILIGAIYIKKTQVTIKLATKVSQIMKTNLAASLSFDDKASAKNILKSLKADTTIEGALIYDKNKKLFSSYLASMNKEQAVAMLKLLKGSSTYNDINNIIVSSNILLDNESIGKLFLIYNTNEIKNTLKMMLTLLLGIALVVFVIMLKISSVLQRRLTKPIYTLINTMEDILSQNNYTKKITQQSDDEFQTLFDGFNTMLDKIHENKIDLEGLANTDPLTGLYNRRYFFDFVNSFIDINSRKDDIYSILMFDIDKFKNVNDTYGHDVGDKVIVSLTNIFKKNVRKGDVFARFGGEEFIAFLPYTNAQTAVKVAEKIRNLVELSHDVENVHFTVSVGVADSSNKKHSIKDIIKLSDTALYQAKENGRNRVVIF